MEKTHETKKRYQAMKAWLKAAAIDIHAGKAEFKDRQRNGKNPFQKLEKYGMWVDGLSNDYRHRHIAYSELRGHTRDQIEKPAEDNLPDEDLISKYKLQILEG